MIHSEESDNGRFGGGEGDGQPCKRSKPRAPRKKKTQKNRSKKEDNKKGRKLVFQTYKRTVKPWCGICAINNIMQIHLINPIAMVTACGSFQGDLEEDIDSRLHVTPEVAFLMDFLVINGYSGAPIVPAMIIQLAALEQYYLVTRGVQIALIEEGQALNDLLARNLRIHVELEDYAHEPPEQFEYTPL